MYLYVKWCIHRCHDSFICHRCHDSFLWVPWLIRIQMPIHSYVVQFIHRCHDSFVCHRCDESYISVPWLIWIEMPGHSYVPRCIHRYYVSFICHRCYESDIYKSDICVPWLIYVWRDSSPTSMPSPSSLGNRNCKLFIVFWCFKKKVELHCEIQSVL